MVTRLFKVIKYANDLPPIYFQDPSMRLSCEVTLRIKYISPLVEDPWTPN